MATVMDNTQSRFCFLVGAGGTGKTTLADMFVATVNEERVSKINEVARAIIRERGITQADLADDNLFWDLQVNIAKRQCYEERACSATCNGCVISDRSVLDALIYSLMRFPGKSLDLPHESEEEFTFYRLCELVGSVEDGHEVLRRYRSSLVVLVHPFDNNNSIDDNVRLVMTSVELDQFTMKFHHVLKLFGVPFLDLRETSKEGRLNLLQEAFKRISEEK